VLLRVPTGLANTTGRYVAVLDADLEYLPSDLLSMLTEAESHGVMSISGSRYLQSVNFHPGNLGCLRPKGMREPGFGGDTSAYRADAAVQSIKGGRAFCQDGACKIEPPRRVPDA
jgi:hypothetical protein